MATFLKRTSVLVVLLTISTVMLLNSCQSGEEKGVWIPIPQDTSALGKIDHFIPVEEIDKFKVQYNVERDSLKRCAPNLFIPVSEAFNKKGLIEILKDPRSVGIRVYYGVKKGEKGNEVRLMMVGVDEQGKDLYYEKGSPAATQAGGGKGGSEYGQCEPPCR